MHFALSVFILYWQSKERVWFATTEARCRISRERIEMLLVMARKISLMRENAFKLLFEFYLCAAAALTFNKMTSALQSLFGRIQLFALIGLVLGIVTSFSKSIFGEMIRCVFFLALSNTRTLL